MAWEHVYWKLSPVNCYEYQFEYAIRHGVLQSMQIFVLFQQ